jgi:hypothetical protein
MTIIGIDSTANTSFYKQIGFKIEIENRQIGGQIAVRGRNHSDMGWISWIDKISRQRRLALKGKVLR